jgi:primosomal protein N' (replication factor Y) (superfamily II helicase)
VELMPAPKQRNLFAAEPLEPELKPWDRAAAADLWVARVVVNRPLDTPFDYLVSDALRERLKPGMRVRVPFGNGHQRLVGYCVEVGPFGELIGPERFKNGQPPKLKPIEAVLDREPLLSPRMLELTRWIAERYLCGWGQVLDSVVPAGVKKMAGTREILFLVPAKGVCETLGERKLGAKQKVVLEVLCAANRPMRIDELAESADCGVGVISALRDKKLVEAIVHRTETFDVDFAPMTRQPDLQLNVEQHAALDAILAEIRAARHRTILLRGVTGSGKTEVYIQAIREVVAYGRQAIVLVPEISLTPQTIRRFRSRFDSVAVLHSHLSDSERHWHWQRIASGQVQVIVGARSAVFAPTPHLGLIVIDEEHETSFKQEETPRYHAREVARERARLEGIPLLLGTATPTLESWWRASSEFRVPSSEAGQPATACGTSLSSLGTRNSELGTSPSDLLLTLANRVAKLPLPPVTIVDTRNDPYVSRGEALGRALSSQIQLALKDGGQVILFLNLRGFSPVVWCKACGESVRCPHCDITLTFHKDKNRVLCHSCEYESAPLTKCPSCGHPGVYYIGIGTQRLEQEVQSKFGKASCIRMDSDTMKKAGSHDEALERFRLGEAKILLGTQMIAKGLDFPNVTLVGVINADTLLHSPDLRASERTFQLIAQVAGRTGRSDRGGRVFVQSACPTEPAIALAAKHDYLAFAAHELKHRREADAPPFRTLTRIILRGAVEDRVKTEALAMATLLRATAEQLALPVRILGPAPCPITKLRDYWRFHLQLSAESLDSIHALWRSVSPKIVRVSDVEFQIDVEPINLR